MRERYPVYGCSHVICHLRFQLDHNLEQLRRVHLQLAACSREQQHQHQQLAQFEFGSPPSVMTQINDPALLAYQYGQFNPNGSHEMLNQYHVWNENNTEFYAQSSSSSDDTAKPRLLLFLDAATTTTSKNSLEEATRTQSIQQQIDAFTINHRNIFFYARHQDFAEMVDNSMDPRDAFDSRYVPTISSSFS